MARVPFTLRIDSAERAALEDLSKIERRPVNQLLNEAIKSYLRRQGRRESSLEANLAGLRAYRKRDPEFRRGIAAFVDAEASLIDPMEGEPVEGRLVAGQFVPEPAPPTGPVQTKIRDLLGA